MKKHHKVHRHKDPHKRSSKTKHHHKPKKEHPVSESVLEPIQEVSKEKVKIDKNACGDFANSFLVSQYEDDREKKSKRRRKNGEKTDKVEKLDQEEINIFAKSYLQKLTQSSGKKLSRHQSLERDEDGLINKTKNFFRKEKSFNDAVQKVSVDLEVVKEPERDRKRRHRSGKSEKGGETKEKRKKHKHEKSSKRREKAEKVDKLRDEGGKRKKSTRKSGKSREKSPSSNKHMHSRVQEVIYCQLNPVPYKLKNDKGAAEIKDLYQRIKKEKSNKEGEKICKDRSHSHGDNKKKNDLEKERSYQSHHGPVMERMEIKPEKKKERSNSRSKPVHEEHIQKEERKLETHSKEHKHHNRHHHHQEQCFPEDPSKINAPKKRKKDLSNIDLGPYDKYFAFENTATVEHQHKKHHKKDKEVKEHRKEAESSRDKKEKHNQEQVICNLEYNHAACKKNYEKHEDKIDHIQESPIKTDVDKIHQIVEGDLKAYFGKIQHMIDQKLDAILRVTKTKSEKSSKHLKEQEDRKRSKSRTKDKKSEKEERSGCKKEDRSNKLDKNKNNSLESKDDKIEKEEIIQEVLKRIKKEVSKDKEKISIKQADKQTAAKRESREKHDKIQMEDSKKSIDVKDKSHTSSKKRPDTSSHQKIDKKHSRIPEMDSTQKFLNKRHREGLKDSGQRNPLSSHISLDRQHLYEEAKKAQDIKTTKPGYQDNRGSYEKEKKSCRDLRSPDNICRLKNSADPQYSLEKRSLSKDSPVCMGNNSSLPPELVIPAADITSLQWEAYLRAKRRHEQTRADVSTRREKQFSNYSLTKHYTSLSSCKACSEHYLVPPRVAEQRSEQVVLHRQEQKHVASEEIHKEKFHPEDRRGRVPRDKSNRTSEEINIVWYNQNDVIHHRDYEIPYIPQEHVVPAGPEDYIMAPREHRKHRCRLGNHVAHDHYPELINYSTNRHGSKHNMVVQTTDHNLENIILPPEIFRTQPGNSSEPREQIRDHQHMRSPAKQYPKQEFLVHGIEPPILECSRKKPEQQVQHRNLECKTVSIVGIPPQNIVKELRVVNHNQTSAKYEKPTTPDRDLVEKRKNSKRFRLYYKYSAFNNKEDKDSGTSEARSIVSDSCKLISDPSDEEQAAVCYSREGEAVQERHMALEPQVITIGLKKWNRIATPRDSHLKNIIEEPSNVSNSLQNDEYFIPIRGTNNCYFRVLSSSHSEYCFKINKKPANSNISIVSKDTCDGRYRYYEDGKCRYCRHDMRSKSDFNMIPSVRGVQILKSKSDVFLGGASGRKVIRSIFLEDTQPYVRPRRGTANYKPNSPPQHLTTKKVIKYTTSKDCQTSDLKVNVDCEPVNEAESKLAFEDKQRQFQDIYKTIDDLEENIHISVQAPPNTLDVAVSSKCLSLDQMSGKKPQFKEIYKTIDTLQNKMLDTSNKELVKTADAAVGSSLKVQKSSKSEPRKKTHEMAVGDSKDELVSTAKTSDQKLQNSCKRLKTTGVSPITMVEDPQTSSRSPIRKTATPSPSRRPNVARPSTQKPVRNIRDDSPKNPTPKLADTKREPAYLSSVKPKILVVKNAPAKSPERTTADNEDQKNLKQDDVTPPSEGIKVFRSAHINVPLMKREYNNVQNLLADCKPIENVTHTVTETNRMDQNDEEPPEETCFILNTQEDAKPITTRTNNAQVLSKVAVRKPAPKEKRDVPKKTPVLSRGDDLRKSCVHHYHPRDVQNVQKSSRVTTAADTKKPLTVNTAIFKYQPASHKECVAIEGSTSSSLDDDSAQNVRKSKSLVEIRTRRKNVDESKSEINVVICESSGVDTKGGSVISGDMEKFTNVPRLRCHNDSKSNLHSLDQFTGSKFTSKLFLTKDYKGGEISAYQRRKLYDQSIRQKMKKKFKFSKMDVGPQIFEVRFLSMISQEHDQEQIKEQRMKRCSGRPLFALNLEKVKTEGCFYQKGTYKPIRVKDKDGNHTDKDEELTHNVNKYIVGKGNVIGGNTSVSKDNLKSTDEGQQKELLVKANFSSNEDAVVKNINTNVDDKTVTQLYFKDQKMNQKKLLSFCNKLLEVNSSLELPEEFKGGQCSCSKFSVNCQACKNFVNLMDILCSSVALYCNNSKMNIVDFKLENDSEVSRPVDSDSGTENNVSVNKHDTNEEFDHLRVNLPNLEIQETSNNVQEIFSRCGNNSSGYSREYTDDSDQIFKNFVECVSLSTTKSDNVSSLSHPVSCPILPTNSTSFEFLYEEASSSDGERISRERVLANLTKPFDQTFNFSMSQYNVETPFFRRDSYFSATESSESGYASIQSKSCRDNSLTNFFKKPSIAALFRPPVLTGRRSKLSKLCQQKGQGDFKKRILYEKMTKSCQLYAKKVRESSKIKLTGTQDEYQEFSLALLLGKNSSVVLESTALKQHSSTHTVLIPNKDVELNGYKKDSEETDTFSDADHKRENFSRNNEISFVKSGCRLVLNNECLKIDSITYLEADIFKEQSPEPRRRHRDESPEDFADDDGKRDQSNTSFQDNNSSFTLDSSLGSNNPFVPNNDSLTQKFFKCLLKIYETEMEVCNGLFKNDEFLNNVLLPAVENRKNEEKRNKTRRFSRFFRRKSQDNQTTFRGKKCEELSTSKASTKLKMLASNAKKCFTMLAEAVKINENMDDEIKICGILKLLERIESGDFHMIKNDGDSNIEQEIKSQVKEAFINLYKICEKEAKKAKRNIGAHEINLIKEFVSKYRIALLSETDIVACYIGRGIIQTEAQLKAAVTYLMRSQSNEVNSAEFEEYCNFNTSAEK